MSAAAVERKKEQGGVFKLLIGTHLGDGPKDCTCDACTASGGKSHVYTQGDTIESNQDLAARYNQGPFSRKFARAGEDEGPPKKFPLEKMKIGQLLAVAADEEVDVEELTDKESIIAALRAAGYKE